MWLRAYVAVSHLFGSISRHPFKNEMNGSLKGRFKSLSMVNFSEIQSLWFCVLKGLSLKAVSNKCFID